MLVHTADGVNGIIDVSIANFYGWAERLLSDFDDVDKNMADASALFQNIRDLRELERTDYLTEEQTEVLQRFFKEFDPEHQSEIRERFSRLWNALLPIYEQLNAELASEGLAYEGAAFRRTVDRLKAGEVAPPAHVDKYVFVGFNVLDRVEWQLFSQLQKMEKALFYWDYDKYYLPSEKERFLSEDDRQLSPEGDVSVSCCGKMPKQVCSCDKTYNSFPTNSPRSISITSVILKRWRWWQLPPKPCRCRVYCPGSRIISPPMPSAQR